MKVCDIEAGKKFILVGDIDLEKHGLQAVPVYIMVKKGRDWCEFIGWSDGRPNSCTIDDGLYKEPAVPLNC